MGLAKYIYTLDRQADYEMLQYFYFIFILFLSLLLFVYYLLITLF